MMRGAPERRPRPSATRSRRRRDTDAGNPCRQPPRTSPRAPIQGTSMNLIQRAQDILLRPRDTWPVIDAEPATTASVYRDWLVIIAAVPAVAGFIGLSLVGMGMMGYGYRMPIVYG